MRSHFALSLALLTIAPAAFAADVVVAVVKHAPRGAYKAEKNRKWGEKFRQTTDREHAPTLYWKELSIGPSKLLPGKTKILKHAWREVYPSDWTATGSDALSGADRAWWLVRAYEANTPGVRRLINSDSTQPRNHDFQVCFEGSAHDLINEFFHDGRVTLDDTVIQGPIHIRADDTGRQIGIKFSAIHDVDGERRSTNPRAAGYFKHNVSFVLSACDDGRGGLLDDVEEDQSGKAREKHLHSSLAKKTDRSPAAQRRRVGGGTTPTIGGTTPTGGQGASVAEGFVINDTPSNGVAFQLKDNYSQAPAQLPAAESALWLDTSKGGNCKNCDLTSNANMLNLSVALQHYAYNSLALYQADHTDENTFYAQNANGSFWCHMPWLNAGPRGREGRHGLTNEKALAASPNIYPNAPTASDWGVGFYNTPGCQMIGAVFGDGSNPNPTPNFDVISTPKTAGDPNSAGFADGTVSVKILFTTGSGDFGGGKVVDSNSTFTWTANVSTPTNNQRTLTPVHHVQMDIAIKDSRIAGMNALINGQPSNWAMFTYYFDPTYDGSKVTAPNGTSIADLAGKIPPGLFHMRPMGAQPGFNAGEPDSLVASTFSDGSQSQTNGNGPRLNGPADNPISSCMSCHATSGTSIPIAPGVQADSEFQGSPLDFSQQMSLAKRNYDTSFGINGN